MISSSPVKISRSASKKLNTLSKDGSLETTSMVDLPRDLAEEGFSRLPVTSLRGARCTCKKWNTLTKDESFFKKHIAEQASTELTVVMVIEFRVYLMSLNLHDRPSITCQGKLTSLDNSDRVDISLVYHCDGLLLCIAKDFASFVVRNPYTGQTLWLKPRTIGYVENSKSSCRKILRFVDPLGNEFVEYEIYDLSSNSWRVLDVTSDWHIDFYARGVSLKGNTYWFSRERYPAKPAVGEPFKVADFLICFDFTTERFGPRLSLPFHTGFECTVSLSSVREEQLAVLLQVDYLLRMEIWVTTKIEPEEVSWNMLFFAVNMEPFLDFQFGMSQGNISEEANVIAMNLNKKSEAHSVSGWWSTRIRKSMTAAVCHAYRKKCWGVTNPDLIDQVRPLVLNVVGAWDRDYRQINVAYKTKPMLKRVLDEYNLRYKTIVEANVHTAIIAIKGNPKLAEDAIVDAGLEASVCEGGFPKDQSPLTDLTQKMAKICDVTRAIVRMFL
ncbi:hypothetical protein Bca4012_004331 [Brassica carinata]